jgi:hypothetical protein
MRKGFLTNISYTNGLLATGILILVLSTAHCLFAPAGNIQIPQNSFLDAVNGKTFLGFTLSAPMQNIYINHIFRLLNLLGSALLLQYISTEYRLIRVRSYFPFFWFCILSATILPALPMTGTSFSCIFLCLACIRLFRAFEKENHYKAIFDASLLLSIASVFQVRLLYLFPVIWLIMFFFRMFTFRSLVSSMLGFLCIYWFIGGLSFLMSDFSFLKTMSEEIITFRLVDFSGIPPFEIVYMAFLGFLMISSMISFLPKQHLDKLLTRNYLNSVILLWFALFILWVFSGNDLEFLFYLFSLSALMLAHFFSLVDTWYSRILFLLFLISSIAFYFSSI